MLKIILATAGFAVSGALFFLYTQPTYDEASRVNQEIVRYDEALSKATDVQTRSEDLNTKFNAIPKELQERLKKMLPDHVDNVRLILDLDHLAGLHGMALQNVGINLTSEGATKGTAIGAAASHEKFDSLTMKFTVSGTYQEFMRFLTDIESSLRIVDVIQLSISGGTTPLGQNEPLYNFDFLIRTYWLK